MPVGANKNRIEKPVEFAIFMNSTSLGVWRAMLYRDFVISVTELLQELITGIKNENRQIGNVCLQKSFKSIVSLYENLTSNFCAIPQPFNLRSKVIHLRFIKRREIEVMSNLLMKPLMEI